MFFFFLMAQEQFKKYQKNKRKYQWAEFLNITSWTQQIRPLSYKLCDKTAFSYSYLLPLVAQKPVVVLSQSHNACLTGVFLGTLTENVYRDIEVMDLNSKVSRNTDLIVSPSSPCACSLLSQLSWLAQLKWCFKPTSTAPKKHSQAYQVDGILKEGSKGSL